MKFYLHMCYFPLFFFVFVYLSSAFLSYFIFSISTFAFLTQFWLNYTHELYIHTLLIIVAYFVNTFDVEILCSFMRYFQCFSSPFPAFIIMSICTHSHGSAKNWLHSSLSIHRYMLKSTKIEFWEVCVVLMKLILV